MGTGQKVKRSLPEAVFFLDDTGILTDCNKVAETLFGWTGDEIKGKKISAVILPDESRAQFMEFQQNCNEAEDNGQPAQGVELNVLHRNGTVFPVELNRCTLTGSSHCSFILTARDSRERKRRVKGLEQVSRNQQIVNSILRISLQEYSLEEILLHALEYIILFNIPKLKDKGAVLLVADASDHLLLKAHKGFDKSQIQSCRKIPFGTCHCGRAALTGEIQFSECVDAGHDIRPENMTPHGHYCVPICSGEKILGVLSLYLQEGHRKNNDEKEMLWAISNILAGVIERKKNEIQRHRLIKKQEAMITRISDEKKLTESIIQSLNAGLMVCDHKRNIVILNPSGRTILSQFLDKGLSNSANIIRFAEIPAVQLMLEIWISPDERMNEVSQLNKSGEERTLQYTAVPWENSSGRQIGIILQFKDITETLRIQQEMEKMNRLSTVAEIASAVAHEVRNPLAGIKTMSQAIEENCAEHDENKEYITRIIKQVDRLNNLLTDFFSYAKPGKAQKTKVSIEETVNEIRQLFKVKLESCGILLEEEYDDGLPDIYVDPDQIQQVLLNLMLNAIDSIEKNGKIQICAQLADHEVIRKYVDLFPDLKKNADYVAVFFRDNGKGMSPDVAASAFEPFFTTKHHGAGLGLATVYRILNENNAFIMIDPYWKQGVCFLMMFESLR